MPRIYTITAAMLNGSIYDVTICHISDAQHLCHYCILSIKYIRFVDKHDLIIIAGKSRGHKSPIDHKTYVNSYLLNRKMIYAVQVVFWKTPGTLSKHRVLLVILHAAKCDLDRITLKMCTLQMSTTIFTHIYTIYRFKIQVSLEVDYLWNLLFYWWN